MIGSDGALEMIYSEGVTTLCHDRIRFGPKCYGPEVICGGCYIVGTLDVANWRVEKP